MPLSDNPKQRVNLSSSVARLENLYNFINDVDNLSGEIFSKMNRQNPEEKGKTEEVDHGGDYGTFINSLCELYEKKLSYVIDKLISISKDIE